MGRHRVRRRVIHIYALDLSLYFRIAVIGQACIVLPLMTGVMDEPGHEP